MEESEKGTTAWCDARDEHIHDDNTSSHRASSPSVSRWNEVDEPWQSKSVMRPFDLLNEEDVVKLERELEIHRDYDRSEKFRSLKSSSSKRTHDEADAAENSDGKRKKMALGRRVKKSVEEDHLENVHDDTLEIQPLHTVNVLASKCDSVDEQTVDWTNFCEELRCGYHDGRSGK